jgi:hypothetical protein
VSQRGPSCRYPWLRAEERRLHYGVHKLGVPAGGLRFPQKRRVPRVFESTGKVTSATYPAKNTFPSCLAPNEVFYRNRYVFNRRLTADGKPSRKSPILGVVVLIVMTLGVDIIADFDTIWTSPDYANGMAA